MGRLQQGETGFRARDGRTMGLGDCPPCAGATNADYATADEMLEGVLRCGMTQVPVIEYTTWTINLPLTDIEVAQTFGDQVNLLQITGDPPGVDDVDSSFVINGLLQSDMLVIGFGIHAFGEPLGFSVIGNAMPTSGNAFPIVSADAWTLNDLAANSLGLTAGVTPAVLDWGHKDWEALWHFANAYQFIWRVEQRHNVVQEMVADVCHFGPFADAIAASSSEEPTAEYVQRVNGRYAQKGCLDTFVPINARRVGSVNTNPGGSPNAGVFHADRSYDTVPATFGGIKNQGPANTGSAQYRKLPRPALLKQGIPIGMLLQATNQFHQSQFQRLLSISNSTPGGGTSAIIPIAATVSGATIAGTANTGLELTLDPVAPANVFHAQQFQTNRELFKGGTLKLAILLKGVELWGNWRDYVQQKAKNGDTRFYIPGLSGPNGTLIR
jgi:hypothetical protein